MRVVEHKLTVKNTSISIVKPQEVANVFDIAEFQKGDAELIKQLFKESYEKHSAVLTALVVSRIALNSALHDTDRNVAEVATQSNTSPVQINNEDTIEKFDAIFSKALHEYAINASAEIAVPDLELRKEYINNFNSKPAGGGGKPLSTSEIGVRLSRENMDKPDTNPVADYISKLEKQRENLESPDGSPYGLTERKPADGKLTIVRKASRGTRPRS